MKLVKIEDVRVGQIWIVEFDTNRAIVIKNVESEQIDVDVFADKQFYCENNFNKDISGLELIGFLGITHEIKDNRFVEIPREDFQVDDVVVDLEEDDETSFIITAFNSSKRYSSGIGESTFYFPLTRNLKKIGIYGVTHEFVNERLAK